MSVTPFQTEAWTEYGLGTVVLLLRYFARWKTVGFKNWQGDDWFAVVALVFWTAELVMLELIGRYGTNIGITNKVAATLTDDDIARRVVGSKCLLAGWNLYTTLIFCLKGTILCFYRRMTLGLKQQRIVKWTQYATIVAYVAVMAVVWGHCTPVHKNWQVVPYPGDQCTLAIANYLALVVLNISTDLAIVSIPVPLLWTVKLNLQRKAIISVLLCSGVFIMVATLLRCILSLKDINGIDTSTIWAIRETFVAIVATNAAAIKPLFSASRWIGSSKGSSERYKSSGYASNGYPLATIAGSSSAGCASASRHHHHRKMGVDDLLENSSEEQIVKKGADYAGFKNDIRAGSTASEGSMHRDGIMVTRTYEVDEPQKARLDV